MEGEAGYLIRLTGRRTVRAGRLVTSGRKARTTTNASGHGLQLVNFRHCTTTDCFASETLLSNCAQFTSLVSWDELELWSMNHAVPMVSAMPNMMPVSKRMLKASATAAKKSPRSGSYN